MARLRPIKLRSHRPRPKNHFGGTLLEVLVSLVILTMVAMVLLQVNRNARLNASQIQRGNRGLQAAMRWRVAHAAGEQWAQGHAGVFESDGIRWTISSMIGAVADGGTLPDENWRQLSISDDDGTLVSLPLRDAAVPTDGATSQSSFGVLP